MNHKRTFQSILFGLAVAVGLGFVYSHKSAIQIQPVSVQQIGVEDVLFELGVERPNHSMRQYDSTKASLGEDLIFAGNTNYNGKKSKQISKHFVCTDCHNLVREIKNPNNNSPENRLAYAVKHGIPFLQGSTFFGIYNRSTWYNGDYVKKYGDLVINSRDTLENAVQLCAKYCSSGRYLDQWELEAIMHYFKKTELKVKDLNLDDEIMEQLKDVSALTKTEKESLKYIIESAFIQTYPATFLPTMPRDDRKYGVGGDAKIGKQIFDKSCMYCHENGRITYLKLDDDVLTARMFWRNIKDYNDKTLYQIIRYGTYPKAGRKQYMPQYTKEKMSDQQIEDLVAYIRVLAKK